MVPKPFPFPIGIGVDMCKIDRIASLIRQESLRNRWARRVFTRLEWTGLSKRFQQANLLEGELLNQAKIDAKASDPEEIDQNNIWTLPKLSKHSSILESDNDSAYWSAIADERSRLGRLVRYLTGRWAAKEAAIKAHRHRRLYMQDISIVSSRNNTKAMVLIDPVCNVVQMDERVAALRGLRGFGPQSRGLNKGPLMLEDTDESEEVQRTKSKQFNRRRKVQETERQIAEINISHDGEYGVAVCMALDAPTLHPEGRHIIDNGTGPAMHEPQWGDEGWFDQDYWSKDDGWKNKSMDDLLEGAKPSLDRDDYGAILKQALESADEWKIPQLP